MKYRPRATGERSRTVKELRAFGRGHSWRSLQSLSTPTSVSKTSADLCRHIVCWACLSTSLTQRSSSNSLSGSADLPELAPGMTTGFRAPQFVMSARDGHDQIKALACVVAP